jgi:hypothetical protein
MDQFGRAAVDWPRLYPAARPLNKVAENQDFEIAE